MVRRIAVPEAVLSLALLERVDYGDAFEARTSTSRTPREWGDLILDRGSPAVFGLVRTAHARVGRMPLAPPDHEHPLGWNILQETDAQLVMGIDGGILTPRVVICTPPGRIVFSTLISFETAGAQRIWTLGRYVHRAVARYLVAVAIRSD